MPAEPIDSAIQNVTDGLRIDQLGSDDDAFAAAFCFALSGRRAKSYEIEAQRHNLNAMSSHGGVTSSVFVASGPRDEMAAAALFVESPGRSALVHLGQSLLAAPAASAIMERIVAHAKERNLKLLQTLLDTRDTNRARMIKNMQFEYLAELIYMDCEVANSGIGHSALRREFELHTLNATNELLFLTALERTYADSLDCPDLTPVRTAADAFAGHKSTGKFDPKGFYVVTQADEPVAILLTSRVIDRSAIEIVYMGVCSTARRGGLGRALLTLAAQRAYDLRMSHVTLAVDAINTPARKLYDGFGFVELARRRAWIRCV